jgi:DNA repair protein RadC
MWSGDSWRWEVKEERKEAYISIKHYPEEMRPREKLLFYGAEALSDQELLAILLRTGTKNKSALDLAQDLLLPKGFVHLVQMSVEELCDIKGMGEAKAAQVKAALEIGRRLAKQKIGFKPTIHSPVDAAKLLVREMNYLDREHFKVINLNTKSQVLGIDNISIGSLNASLVHPREVFKQAIKRSTARLILVHNHPSGDPQPSREDLALTKRLCEAGELLGIPVLDHIILGNNNYLSMKEEEYF